MESSVNCHPGYRSAAVQAVLAQYVRKYIWWQSPEEALQSPHRVAAQVMSLGSFRDMQNMAANFGDDLLRDVLLHAEAGWFTPRAWSYWHCRLYPGRSIPPMPKRSFL